MVWVVIRGVILMNFTRHGFNLIVGLLIVLVPISASSETIADALQAAVNEASRLKNHNEYLDGLVESYKSKINSLEAVNINLQEKLSAATAEANDWKARYADVDVIDQVLIEAGEYNRGLAPVGIRIDPRNGPIEGAARNFCARKGKPIVKVVSSRSGGCCGYTYAIASCLKGK